MPRRLRAMFDFFRPAPRPPACDACPYVPPPRQPDRETERRLADLERAVEAAGITNDRAAMGLVATAGRAMRAESGIQAMLRGALREVDRDHDA